MLRLLMLSGATFVTLMFCMTIYSLIVLSLESYISEETMHLLEKIQVVIGVICFICLGVFACIVILLFWIRIFYI